MPEKHLFEYAIIRAVPRVEREEFINIGVIVYCSTQRFLKMLYNIDQEKLLAIDKQSDIWDLLARLRGFEKICNGTNDGGPISLLPIASRFRWLTSTRSTIVQSSKIHPGLCFDAEKALQKLFTQMVL